MPKFDLGRRFGIVTFAVTLCLLIVFVGSVAGQSSQVSIPILTSHVTLDGMWTSTNEWSDSIEITSPGGYFRLKHDTDSLYVLFDFLSDNALENQDVAWVYIDSLKNGGSSPQSDDYAFTLQWSSPSQSYLAMEKGTGTDWVGASPALHSAVSSKVATNDPYSSTSHAIYEFKVPMAILPQGATSMGVRLAMHEGATNTWMVYPKDSLRTTPNQWGTMELSPTPIPEFSAVIPIVALALIVPLYLIKRSNAKLPQTNQNSVLWPVPMCSFKTR